MKIAVITVSDRASRGAYEDLSGPAIRTILAGHFGLSAELSSELVADEPDQIEAALDNARDADIILTTGGTGLGPRDITPEISRRWCSREVPGIAEALRAHSLAETSSAMLSRGFAGQRGTTLLINLPGSVKAVTSCTNYLLPVLAHGVRMMHGEGH